MLTTIKTSCISRFNPRIKCLLCFWSVDTNSSANFDSQVNCASYSYQLCSLLQTHKFIFSSFLHEKRDVLVVEYSSEVSPHPQGTFSASPILNYVLPRPGGSLILKYNKSHFSLFWIFQRSKSIYHIFKPTFGSSRIKFPSKFQRPTFLESLQSHILSYMSIIGLVIQELIYRSLGLSSFLSLKILRHPIQHCHYLGPPYVWPWPHNELELDFRVFTQFGFNGSPMGSISRSSLWLLGRYSSCMGPISWSSLGLLNFNLSPTRSASWSSTAIHLE